MNIYTIPDFSGHNPKYFLASKPVLRVVPVKKDEKNGYIAVKMDMLLSLPLSHQELSEKGIKSKDFRLQSIKLQERTNSLGNW